MSICISLFQILEIVNHHGCLSQLTGNDPKTVYLVINIDA